MIGKQLACLITGTGTQEVSNTLIVITRPKKFQI